MHAEGVAKGTAGMLLQYAIRACVSLADGVVSDIFGHRWDLLPCDYVRYDRRQTIFLRDLYLLANKSDHLLPHRDYVCMLAV
jgi:hypothetical protein